MPEGFAELGRGQRVRNRPGSRHTALSQQQGVGEGRSDFLHVMGHEYEGGGLGVGGGLDGPLGLGGESEQQ